LYPFPWDLTDCGGEVTPGKFAGAFQTATWNFSFFITSYSGAAYCRAFSIPAKRAYRGQAGTATIIPPGGRIGASGGPAKEGEPMDINEAERLGTDRLEAYQTVIVALARELVHAAANGQYRRAGRVFTRLLQLQADNALLPDHEGYEVILGQLNGIPSKVLGIA
jgi:hypothetical protein